MARKPALIALHPHSGSFMETLLTRLAIRSCIPPRKGNESQCALHLGMPNEMLQTMLIMECLRTLCAHADFMQMGGDFFLIGCAHLRGRSLTDKGELTRPLSNISYN